MGMMACFVAFAAFCLTSCSKTEDVDFNNMNASGMYENGKVGPGSPAPCFWCHEIVAIGDKHYHLVLKDDACPWQTNCPLEGQLHYHYFEVQADGQMHFCVATHRGGKFLM